MATAEPLTPPPRARATALWDRDTGETQIFRDASLLVFPVRGTNADDAVRHPFRYAP